MKEISEEDKEILKGNLNMKYDSKSSKTQVAIANTVILDIMDKYFNKEIDDVFNKCFNTDFDNFVSAGDIKLCNSK
jgi:hypothetical protein